MNDYIRTLFAAGNWRKMRHALDMNQTEFWKPVGVTQSGGCRYESGRRMPRQVQELMRLYYIEGIDVPKLKRHHVSSEALLDNCRKAGQ